MNSRGAVWILRVPAALIIYSAPIGRSMYTFKNPRLNFVWKDTPPKDWRISNPKMLVWFKSFSFSLGGPYSQLPAVHLPGVFYLDLKQKPPAQPQPNQGSAKCPGSFSHGAGAVTPGDGMGSNDQKYIKIPTHLNCCWPPKKLKPLHLPPKCR